MIKDVTKTIENKTKKQKSSFLGMLLGTLGANLLRNMLLDKGFFQADNGFIRAREETTSPYGKASIRAGQGI